MAAQIISRNEEEFTIQVSIPYRKSMLEFEEVIQQGVNEIGTVATGEALEYFDTDGSPILMGSEKWTSKGKVAKPYQTPYGATVVERHIYQSSRGGRGFCPLERDARIILSATPKFAKQLSSKYSEYGSSRVQEDLESNHGRKVARSFIQNVCDAIGAVAFAKETEWEYAMPEMDKAVSQISIGLDGTCMLMCEDGYRESMVGTIGFYDSSGKRQHTIYTAATPEYGKRSFLLRLEEEVNRVKRKYPYVKTIGLADGAKDNWSFLKRHTQEQVLDFWHATGYLGRAAAVMFKGKRKVGDKEEWLNTSCHNLKHKVGASSRILREIELYAQNNRLPPKDRKEMREIITYLKNNKGRMKYAKHVKQNTPIGSGVTEAACKVLVKQRLCGSGMKWVPRGAAVVLALRCLNYTKGRWGQFWKKIDRYGFPVAALNHT